ncbi:MAG: hypothetical protein ACYS9Y_04400 [Planctomycetota bacterium]|jgi:hypothetical protein
MYENLMEFLKADRIPASILGSIEYDGQLSVTAYAILAVVLLGIIAGLGWCFYRAVMENGKPVEPQYHDEVGD